jgi:hypothetical protein
MDAKGRKKTGRLRQARGVEVVSGFVNDSFSELASIRVDSRLEIRSTANGRQWTRMGGRRRGGFRRDNGAGFSGGKGIQVNRERTRKGAKFERQEEMFPLTDFAHFRVIPRFTQNVEASQGAGISMPANGCRISETARASWRACRRWVGKRAVEVVRGAPVIRPVSKDHSGRSNDRRSRDHLHLSWRPGTLIRGSEMDQPRMDANGREGERRQAAFGAITAPAFQAGRGFR